METHLLWAVPPNSCPAPWGPRLPVLLQGTNRKRPERSESTVYRLSSPRLDWELWDSGLGTVGPLGWVRSAHPPGQAPKMAQQMLVA